jgi:hypothetical protein
MKFLFDGESFSFEALRTTGFAAYGGADLGEQGLACGHRVSAREALLRAANYCRSAGDSCSSTRRPTRK